MIWNKTLRPGNIWLWHIKRKKALLSLSKQTFSLIPNSDSSLDKITALQLVLKQPFFSFSTRL